MSSYPYSLLSPDGDNIRLLRLLPNKDEAAPLHCELCNYSLQRSSPRTHLYEALSYVTVNLHAALLRLRDHTLERFIWVDAICINQREMEERKQQLGEQAAEITEALQDIQLAANKELTECSKKEIKQQAILDLLQNRWFQRIWEVAAARHIVIMCGSTTIDGYAFCLRVKSLNLSYTASPKLQTLPSVIYLMERAGLRPKHTSSLPEMFSLNIRSLAELIDMFHARKATDPRDKVYALLGISSNDPKKAGLQPDYEISWEELFQQLVKFVLGKEVFVETSSQRAVIKSKGCILGQVSSVTSDDKQNMFITSKNAAWHLGDKMEWTLQASAKSIREYNIVCLLQGASKPTIIRQCKDHFAVVVIAATPLNKGRSFGLSELSKSMAYFPRDFLLV
ncbi:hypothetical protein BKA61DRAFT_643463 [Leptodontidium sp. MPI-SDFR-AT-0119]|nr:hypothetical protein BKA61DRAFT_643463 [Leptodontidium sp. MPI-SDFR-AT-0119]